MRTRGRRGLHRCVEGFLGFGQRAARLKDRLVERVERSVIEGGKDLALGDRVAGFDQDFADRPTGTKALGNGIGEDDAPVRRDFAPEVADLSGDELFVVVEHWLTPRVGRAKTT